MKTRIMFCSIVLLLSVFTVNVFGGTEGATNTFYGFTAGSNTTGDDDFDTFIGAGAGFYNTTGGSNTFIGALAGGYNTTGSYNTFLGRGAGLQNTVGEGNSFMGYQTGNSNTTGQSNSFMGYQAGGSNTAGIRNTFIGSYAGAYSTGDANTYLGCMAGYISTSGYYNTFLGYSAGYNNTSGYHNTYIGYHSGFDNATGYANVFLGYNAGANETGSNKLYIDNSNTSTPLIYGEFDNNILTINGNLEVVAPNNGLIYLTNVTTDNTTKVSRMVLNHYSNAELPVYLFGAASTATNNFVAFGGGNTIGNASTQIDLFTAPTTTTLVGYPRLTIKGNGYVGIGTQTPSYPLEMAGGAYTNGSSWVDASSREYKDNIEVLSTEEALDTLKELNPVKFAYKRDRTEKHVGFIAEEVPDLIATKDRKGLSPMDIVAVLTKVVQEQRKEIEGQKKDYQKTISMLSERMDELERALQLKGTLAPVK